MKIFTEDGVYVQRSDIDYLTYDLHMIIPESITKLVYGDGLRIIDKSNGDSFIKFTDEKSIEFFRDDDIILDYNEVKDLTDVRQIDALIKELMTEFSNILVQAQKMLLTERDPDDEEENEEFEKESDKLDLQVDKKLHRQKSLYAYRNHLNGKRKIKLPDEITEETKKKKFKISNIFRLKKGKKKV